MKLFVGNLPLSFSEEDVTKLFEDYNTQSIKLISDRETGRFRGFAFVEFESKDEGQKAIDELNSKDVDGRALVVNEARPQQKRDNNNNNRRSFNKRRF